MSSIAAVSSPSRGWPMCDTGCEKAAFEATVKRKRTRAFLEARSEDPNNSKLKTFRGWPAVVFPHQTKDGKPGLWSDAQACKHYIRDANSRNFITTTTTIITGRSPG